MVEQPAYRFEGVELNESVQILTHDVLIPTRESYMLDAWATEV